MQGRKKSYTEEQRAEGERRLLTGEKPKKVSEATGLSIAVVYEIDRHIGTKHVREALKLAASEVKP